MIPNKKAQGLSITVIVIALIALVVLVVLVMIFTGRLGGFTSGLDKSISCENSCNAIGMYYGSDSNAAKDDCTTPNRYLPGTYDDAPTGCCCLKSVSSTP